MPKIKHLLFVFILFFAFASPVWSVDFNCPGGTWYLVSNSGCNWWGASCSSTCTITSGGTKTMYNRYCGGQGCPNLNCADTSVWGLNNVCQPCGSHPGRISDIANYEWRCPCTGSETKTCYDGPTGTEGVGICRAGAQTCSNGWFGSCQGQVLPQIEICGDGIDNNCNGQIDEGCAVCTDGQTRACAYTGPYGTENIGICRAGTQTCSGGQWGSCQGEVIPGALECNGQDNNCDGTIDNQQVCQCSTEAPSYSSVNAASGNLSHSQELFSTKGVGLTTGITLYYDSQNNYTGPLGKKWTHTYDINLHEIYDGSMILNQGNGKGKFYTKSSSGYISQPGDYSSLVKNTDSTYTITQKDGIKYNFNTSGKIASITDRNNNTMSFAYANGNLASITDTSGRITTLSYNTNNHIVGISDPAGNNYTFGYTGNTLVSVTNPDGGQWSYNYDTDAYMLSKKDPNNNITTYGYDSNHREIIATNPEGRTKTMTYSPGDKTSQMTESDGGTWTYNYDTKLGGLLQKTDPQNNTTTYTYDSNKNLISKTDPDGTTTAYTYDDRGNMLSTTDALNQTTTYTYDSFNRLVQLRTPNSELTTYAYDANDNLTSTTDPTGATTQYQYDTRGNIVQLRTPNSQFTTFTYDQYNNLTTITDPTGAVTRFTHDAAGNMLSTTDASGNTTYFQYDSLNHLIKITDPSGSITTYTYDKNGNKTSQTDANGNTTTYEYNYKGQLIKVIDALGNITTYTYGGTACASCTSGADKLTSITDAKGQTTTYAYDTLGRLIKETDPLGNSITYSYDAKGNLTAKTDAKANKTIYEYDALNRLTLKSYPDWSYELYTYDTRGNLIQAQNKHITYTMLYDANGRMTGITELRTSNSLPAQAGEPRTISYTYNTAGNKTSMTIPDRSAQGQALEGMTITYTYDANNRLTTLKDYYTGITSYTYDKTGRRTSITLPNNTFAQYQYDTNGRLTSLTHTNSKADTITSFDYTLDKAGNRLTKTTPGKTISYGYDAIYRLTGAISSGTVEESYTYDPVGNRLTSLPDRTYTYNTSNQLTNFKNKLYTYDQNGNLISKTEEDYDEDVEIEGWFYEYDYENRLTKAIKREKDELKTITFKYDPFGRRIEKNVESIDKGITETKLYTYVYDHEDIILEYLLKTPNSELTTTRYIHGPGIDEPISIERNANMYYYHADGLGSITTLTDQNQNIVESYTYDSFGSMKRKGDKIKNTITYTAREWDDEMGLYYYRARYYDPKVGRFISFDPIVHPANGPPIKGCGNKASDSFNSLISKPPELNPYIYVLDNPPNNIDPYGKLIIIPFLPGTPPYPLLPPSEENCAHYKKDCECGSSTACKAYSVCMNFPDLFWGNCVRGCLKEKYINRTSDYIWLYVDHPVCWSTCPPY